MRALFVAVIDGLLGDTNNSLVGTPEDDLLSVPLGTLETLVGSGEFLAIIQDHIALSSEFINDIPFNADETLSVVGFVEIAKLDFSLRVGGIGIDDIGIPSGVHSGAGEGGNIEHFFNGGGVENGRVSDFQFGLVKSQVCDFRDDVGIGVGVEHHLLAPQTGLTGPLGTFFNGGLQNTTGQLGVGDVPLGTLHALFDFHVVSVDKQLGDFTIGDEGLVFLASALIIVVFFVANCAGNLSLLAVHVLVFQTAFFFEEGVHLLADSLKVRNESLFADEAGDVFFLRFTQLGGVVLEEVGRGETIFVLTFHAVASLHQAVSVLPVTGHAISLCRC